MSPEARAAALAAVAKAPLLTSGQIAELRRLVQPHLTQNARPRSRAAA